MLTVVEILCETQQFTFGNEKWNKFSSPCFQFTIKRCANQYVDICQNPINNYFFNGLQIKTCEFYGIPEYEIISPLKTLLSSMLRKFNSSRTIPSWERKLEIGFIPSKVISQPESDQSKEVIIWRNTWKIQFFQWFVLFQSFNKMNTTFIPKFVRSCLMLKWSGYSLRT